mgnify:CR=1 FL=1
MVKKVRYLVNESSVVKLADDQDTIRFDPGEVTPRSQAEQEALEYLITVPEGDGPKMAVRMEEEE